MSYTTGIPRSGQTLGNSRPQVQGNFDYINTAFAINHVAFNAAGFGKHKFLQMPEQAAAPTTAANEGALYTKESQAITNLFWRQESNGTEIQLTGVAPLAAANGYSTLPGGLIIQWGNTTASGTGTRNILFATLNINFPNNCFQVIAQMQDLPGAPFAYGTTNISTTGFNLRTVASSIPSGTPFSWFAIGN